MHVETREVTRTEKTITMDGLNAAKLLPFVSNMTEELGADFWNQVGVEGEITFSADGMNDEHIEYMETVLNTISQPLNVFIVRSESDFTKQYLVRTIGAIPFYCSCPDHKYHPGKMCKHMRRVALSG